MSNSEIIQVILINDTIGKKLTNIRLKFEMIIHLEIILFFLKINHSLWMECCNF